MEFIDKYLSNKRWKIIVFFDENESCAKVIDNFHNGYYIRNDNFHSRLLVSTEKYKLARVSLSNVFVSFLSRESNSMRKKKKNIVGSRETRNETFVLKGRKNCATDRKIHNVFNVIFLSPVRVRCAPPINASSSA